MNELVSLAESLYKNKHPLFGFHHGYNVMNNAQRILNEFDGNHIDRRIALTSALFHDVAFFDNTSLVSHGEDSESVIREAFSGKDFFSLEEIDEIVRATVRHSRFSWDRFGKPETLVEKIVYDADQIEWLNSHGVHKYYEISRMKGLDYFEHLESLPKDLADRYNNVFLRETKKIVNSELVMLYKFLGLNLLDYLERPEVFDVLDEDLNLLGRDIRAVEYVPNFDTFRGLVLLPQKRLNLDDRVNLFISESRFNTLNETSLDLTSKGQAIIIYLNRDDLFMGTGSKLDFLKSFESSVLSSSFNYTINDNESIFINEILNNLDVRNVNLVGNNGFDAEMLRKRGISIFGNVEVR